MRRASRTATWLEVMGSVPTTTSNPDAAAGRCDAGLDGGTERSYPLVDEVAAIAETEDPDLRQVTSLSEIRFRNPFQKRVSGGPYSQLRWLSRAFYRSAGCRGRGEMPASSATVAAGG